MRREPIRVLLVDDHVVVREGLAALLSMQGQVVVVGQAGSGEDAVRLHAACQPDVTLMDLNLPGIDGIAATRRILLASPGARVLILTTFEGDERIVKALEAGAQAYLIKTASADELRLAVRRAAETEASPGKAGPVWRRLTRTRRDLLTERELQVLTFLSSGASNEAIAEKMRVSINTVRTHVQSVLRKLSVDTRTAAVARGIELGILYLRSRNPFK